jgi:hypothetical protein
MTTQHTPGPWDLDKTSVWSGDELLADAYGGVYAAANARLIAAAPELLAEGRKLDCVEPTLPGPTDCTEEFRRGWLAALDEAYRRAAPFRAALAKAEGQS